MNQDLVTEDVYEQTKRMKMGSLPMLQTNMDDIVGSSTVDASRQPATSSRIDSNEGHSSTEATSLASPLSSTDTFVTAREGTRSKEDCATTEESSISPSSESTTSIDWKPSLEFIPAIATSEINQITNSPPKEPARESNYFPSTSVGTRHGEARPTTIIFEEHLPLKPAPSAVPNIPLSQQPPDTPVTVGSSKQKYRYPVRNSNTKNRNPPSRSNPHDNMTGERKKAAQRQARRERVNLDIMTSINESNNEADELERYPTDYESSQNRTIDDESTNTKTADASSKEPQDHVNVAIRVRESIDDSHEDQASTQPASASTSIQAANRIAARVLTNPQHGSLISRQSRPGRLTANLLSSPWLFNYDQPHTMTNCHLASCSRPTASSDGRTVICPRCGDRSYIRYCSVTHLLADMRSHYEANCGKRENLLMIDESTITPVRAAIREFVRVAVEDHDSAERHRQALHRAYPPESDTTTSTRPEADYYIFSDADRFQASGLLTTAENLRPYRCTGSIAGRVRYEQGDPRKTLFATLLERLLELGYSAGGTNAKGCRMLFMWIKENLVGQKEWTEIMITRMCLAMQLEFGWRVDVDLRE